MHFSDLYPMKMNQYDLAIRKLLKEISELEWI